MWRAYVPPVYYDAAMTAAYVWTIFVLLKRDNTDVGLGDYTMASWVTCLRFDYITRLSRHETNGYKI